MNNQAPFIFSAAYAAYLTTTKTAITAVHLVKNFKITDTYASVVGAQSMANIAMAGADMAVTIVNAQDALVINPKSGLNKTSDSELHFTGLATGATSSKITKTGAAWADFTDKVVHVVSGAGVGQTGKVTSVSGDDLNFEAGTFDVVPDGTSTFEIRDDLWTVYVDGTQVVYAVNETTDKAVLAASADQVNISGTTISMPKLANKAA